MALTGDCGIFDHVARAAAEATTLEDLDAEAIPLLERALDAHLTAVAQFDDDGMPRFKAGNFDSCNPKLYFDRYFADDPVTDVNRRLNPKILTTDTTVDPRVFEKSAAYNEYYRER